MNYPVKTMQLDSTISNINVHCTVDFAGKRIRATFWITSQGNSYVILKEKRHFKQNEWSMDMHLHLKKTSSSYIHWLSFLQAMDLGDKTFTLNWILDRKKVFFVASQNKVWGSKTTTKNSVLLRSSLKGELLLKTFLHFEVGVGVFYISLNICQVIKLSCPLQTSLWFRKILKVVGLSSSSPSLCVLEKKRYISSFVTGEYNSTEASELTVI